MALKVNNHAVDSEHVWDPWETSHALSKHQCIEIANKLVCNVCDAIQLLEHQFEDSLLLEINSMIELTRPGILDLVLLQTLKSEAQSLGKRWLSKEH
jgi:hypothetical protein